MFPPVTNGSSSLITPARSFDCCHALSSAEELKFKTIVHMSLCWSGGMMSLLM